MNMTDKDPAILGAQHIDRLQNTLHAKERLYRRCIAHGAVRTAELLLPELHEQRQRIEADHCTVYCSPAPVEEIAEQPGMRLS